MYVIKVIFSPRPLLALKIVDLEADVVRNPGRLGVKAAPCILWTSREREVAYQVG